MIFWAYLDPCDYKRYPEIGKFEAMTIDRLEPMSKMTDWKWKETMLRGCDMIDDFLKKLERPVINPAVKGKPFPRIANVHLLAKPAVRRVEVLVHPPEGKWWRQSGVRQGETVAKIYLGNEGNKTGTKFSIIAMTTETSTQQSNVSKPPELSHQIGGNHPRACMRIRRPESPVQDLTAKADWGIANGFDMEVAITVWPECYSWTRFRVSGSVWLAAYQLAYTPLPSPW